MKIQRISWQNFKGLSDGEIVANGRDVIISGRNGAGKSSIASILPFVLFGRVPAKSFDERGITIETQIPTATIEFDTVTFKRSVTPRNQNRTFIDGLEVSATQFNAKVLELTGGAGTLLFNPFEFPNLQWKVQRDFLLKHFAPVTKLPANTTSLNDELKLLRREAAGIPHKITELERQLANLPTGDISELEKLLDEKTNEFTRLQAQSSTGRAEIETLKLSIDTLSRQEKFFAGQLKSQENLRESLLAKFHGVKTNCPTCGAPLPKSKVDAAKANIITEGKAAASQIATFKGELANVRTQLTEARKKLSELEKSASPSIDLRPLQQEIRDLNGKIAALDNAGKLRDRLAELINEEKSLNAQIVELEGKIAAAEDERRKQMAASEASVNAQFEHVRFKLFKVLANGEIKEDCAAMISGVPYSSLSKGEKLKAALDILRALQKKFGLEMPLFLDDAESYTSNSFVTIPNQKFLFRVTEADLKVSVDEMRRAA